MENPNLKIGDNIRLLRERKGITRYRLAVEVGTRWEQVYRWEMGAHVPSLFAAARLSYALDCAVDDLLAGLVAAPDGWLIQPEPQGAA